MPVAKKIRLIKFLKKSGYFSNGTEISKALEKKLVKVNGEIVSTGFYFINPNKSTVTVNDEKIELIQEKKYYIVNKPKGYVCQRNPNKKSIYDFIAQLKCKKDIKKTLFCVGRLDKDTSGLLLITNDGDFSNLIMSPENKVNKTYLVTIKGIISDNKIKMLQNGIEITVVAKNEKRTYFAKPINVKVISRKNEMTELYLTINEGKKHQVKKMIAAIESEVIKLHRTSLGPLTLENLKEGEFKEILPEKINTLFQK